MVGASAAEVRIVTVGDAAQGSRDAVPGRPRAGMAPVELLLVGAGGALGTLARYLLGEALPVAGELSTLWINVLGAALLGAFGAVFAGRRPRTQLFLGTGVCGGFTTYSALAVGIAGLGLGGAVWAALALALVTVLAGGAASLLGVRVGERIRVRLESAEAGA